MMIVCLYCCAVLLLLEKVEVGGQGAIGTRHNRLLHQRGFQHETD